MGRFYGDSGPSRLRRWELFAYGGFTFVALGGSAFLFLASRALVYEEALLLVNAFALGSFYATMRFLARP